MRITSPAFAPMAEIPRVHTGDGRDIPPQLDGNGVPAGTRSAVRGARAGGSDSAGDAGERNRGVCIPLPGRIPTSRAPAPPCAGAHRYFHTLYAPDCVLPDRKAPTQATLEQAMAGHVPAQAERVGT